MSGIQSSAPQSDSRPLIPKKARNHVYIERVLGILDARHWTNLEEFRHPWRSQRVTLAHLAAYRGNVDMLKRAAAIGVDLYAPDGFGRSALYHAADQGHINVIEWLMDQPAAHEGPSRTRSPTVPQDGWTPLHAAVYGGHLECVRILINRGLCLANETKDGVTVIDAIFEQIPHPIAFLKEILDKQVSAADDSGHKVNLDFKILTALPNAQVPKAESTSMAKLLVVSAFFTAIRDTEDLKILDHPLVATFIHQEFPFTTPFYLFLLFCDLCFGINLSWCDKYTKVQDLPTFSAFRVFGIILIAATILTYALNTMGIYKDKILRNLFSRSKGIVHFYVLLVAMRLFVIVVPSIVINGICSKDSIDCVDKTFHAIMSLMFWFHTLITLFFLPYVGAHIYMFIAVLGNVLKVLGIFILLIFSFSLSFRVLFFDIDEFSTPGKAFGKTLVMMTGEYDYNDIFSSTNKTNDTSQLVISATIFFVFVIVINIVLMNLMTSLAVNDIKKLLKKGHRNWLREQFRFQWFGLYHLISRLRTRFQNSEQTKELTRTVLLDLKSTSWIPWRRLPQNVKNGLYELALKNSSNRDENSQADSLHDGIHRQQLQDSVDSLRDDMRESLTASRTMLAEIRSIQSSLQPAPRSPRSIQSLNSNYRIRRTHFAVMYKRALLPRELCLLRFAQSSPRYKR